MFMEKRTELKNIAKLCTWVTLLLGVSISHAGVILAPPVPPPVITGPEEDYPESKFGAPPATLSRRQQNEDFSGASRAPAGLEFSDGTPVNSDASLSGGEVSGRDSRGSESFGNVRRGVQETSLIAGDLGFFPKVIFATRDVPVRLYVTGASKNTLCLMMDSFQVRRQIRGGKIEEITFTAGNAGKYRFYCPINGMEGHVVVREPGVSENVDRSVASQAAPKREGDR